MNKNFKLFKVNLDYTLNKITEQQAFIQDEKKLKEYVRETIEDMQEKVKKYVQTFQEDISSIRMENGKYHLEVMKQIEKTKTELADFHKDKDEFQIEFNKYNTRQQEDLKIIEKSFIDFKKNAKAHNELEDDVRDLKKKFIELNGKVNLELTILQKSDGNSNVTTKHKSFLNSKHKHRLNQH